MNFFQRRNIASMALLFPLCTAAFADDAGLYDAPPPPDSAFFRVLNGDASSDPHALRIGDKELKVQTNGLTPYVIVKAGDMDVSGLVSVVRVSLKPGSFYTFAIVNGSGETKLFNDTPLNDPAKSRLYFYNMSDAKDVDIFVPAASKNALENVASDASSSVELKAPLQLEFVARTDAGDLAHFPDVALKRRATVSLVMFGSAGKYTGEVVPNTVDLLASN